MDVSYLQMLQLFKYAYYIWLNAVYKLYASTYILQNYFSLKHVPHNGGKF